MRGDSRSARGKVKTLFPISEENIGETLIAAGKPQKYKKTGTRFPASLSSDLGFANYLTLVKTTACATSLPLLTDNVA